MLVLVETGASSASTAAPPNSTSSSSTQSIWIMDPCTGRAWKTPFLLPQVEALSVASISNSNGECYFTLGSGNRFFVGSIGLSAISSSGSIKFAYSVRRLFELSL